MFCRSVPTVSAPAAGAGSATPSRNGNAHRPARVPIATHASGTLSTISVTTTIPAARAMTWGDTECDRGSPSLFDGYLIGDHRAQRHEHGRFSQAYQHQQH